MDLNALFLIAIISLNIVLGFSMITSYGSLQYSKGQLAGFQECEKLTKEALLKLKEECEKKYEEEKQKQEKDVRIRDTEKGEASA